MPPVDENVHPLPALADGTLTLLAIALKNDRDKQITRSVMLRLAYEAVTHLPEICRAGERPVYKLLDTSVPPHTLFQFCALFLDAVERQADSSSGSSKRWERSEYDHPALLALGQTVARTVGMKSSIGPDLSTAFQRIADAEPGRLQRIFIENYLGNILQDYFDACEVRFNVRDLPEETEQDLRIVEARAMAEWVFNRDPMLTVDEVVRRLGQLMGAVFLEESDRSDARRKNPPTASARAPTRPRRR
jgi:hypothetical protein